MPLTRSDFPDPFEPIYTFVAHNGQNTHVAAKRIRDWCLETQPERFVVPVEQKLAAQFLRENAVLPARLKELMKFGKDGLPSDMKDWEPLIFCQDGGYSEERPDVLLVDGHHRYAVAAALGAPTILAWCLTQEQWRPFEIVGLHEYSQQELIDELIISKEHWGEGPMTIHLRAGSPIEMLEKILAFGKRKE